MIELGFHTLDVFTERRFGGNPLAVVLEADRLNTAQMQRVAREFNLSETVFLLESRHDDAAMRLRIFTPVEELPFAGHPIVGAACALVQLGVVPPGSEARFGLQAEVGVVPVRIHAPQSGPAFAELQTTQPPSFGAPLTQTAPLAACLGLEEDVIGRGAERPRTASCGLPFLLVPLRSPEHLASLVPDRDTLRGLLHETGAHSVYVYAQGYEGEWRCRMFNPDLGEDPATGSAAAALAAHLADHAGGEAAWSGHVVQGLEILRPSRIDLRVERRDGRLGPVTVGGHAVPVMRGSLYVD